MSADTSTDRDNEKGAKGAPIDADIVAREDLQKMGYQQEISRVCPEVSQRELCSTFSSPEDFFTSCSVSALVMKAGLTADL
jgi:hypothetical protein